MKTWFGQGCPVARAQKPGFSHCYRMFSCCAGYLPRPQAPRKTRARNMGRFLVNAKGVEGSTNMLWALGASKIRSRIFTAVRNVLGRSWVRAGQPYKRERGRFSYLGVQLAVAFAVRITSINTEQRIMTVLSKTFKNRKYPIQPTQSPIQI